ncbi:MAG: hypothetical protein IKT27_03375 [Clostridia bacterium]|nr:hypothetical protein [Clostridia bacterium]
MEKATLIHFEPSGIRMITEKLMGGAYHKKIDEMFEPMPFIEEIFENGDISEELKSQAMRIFKLFKTISDTKGIKRFQVIAASIFDSSMKFVKTMFDEINKTTTPFSVHIMTPDEETKYSYNAIVGTIEFAKGVFLKVNLHNCFVVNFAKRSLVAHKPLQFGAYTLMKKFVPKDTKLKPKKIVSDMVKYVKSEVKALNFDVSMFDEVNYVGMGHFFKVIAGLARKITHYPLNVENNYHLSLEAIDKALEILEEQGFDETKRLSGLSHENIAVLLSGFAIIKGFAMQQKAKKFTIASRDIMDSFMASRIVRESASEVISNDHMDISIENTRYFYQIDDSNSEHVHFLTMELFRQMSIVHKLSRKHVRALKTASTLYDSGKRVSLFNHSKFARDVILNSGILNIAHRDLVVAAFGAQCQNLDNFSLADWVRYKEIVNEDDLMIARKIGMIIALASALDCTKQKKIKELSCDLLGDIVIIKAKATEDISYELAEATKLLPNFRKVFKKSFQIM